MYTSLNLVNRSISRQWNKCRSLGQWVELSCSCRPVPQPQWRGIRATLAIYATANGNAESLTHWTRPGIEPASSWMPSQIRVCWGELLETFYGKCQMMVRSRCGLGMGMREVSVGNAGSSGESLGSSWRLLPFPFGSSAESPAGPSELDGTNRLPALTRPFVIQQCPLPVVPWVKGSSAATAAA